VDVADLTFDNIVASNASQEPNLVQGNSSSLTIKHSEFSNNYNPNVTVDGGALVVNVVSLSIDGSTFAHNIAAKSGAGLYIVSARMFPRSSYSEAKTLLYSIRDLAHHNQFDIRFQSASSHAGERSTESGLNLEHQFPHVHGQCSLPSQHGIRAWRRKLRHGEHAHPQHYQLPLPGQRSSRPR